MTVAVKPKMSLLEELRHRTDCVRRQTQDGWGERRSLQIIRELAEREVAVFGPMVREVDAKPAKDPIRKDEGVMWCVNEWHRYHEAIEDAKKAEQEFLERARANP
jgi:hypothetical protein